MADANIRWLPERANRFLKNIGILCNCGSGAHPRRCKKHPYAFSIHILGINMDNEIDSLKFEIEQLKERQDRLSDLIP